MNETTEKFLDSPNPINMGIPLNYRPISTTHQIYRYVIYSFGTIVNILVPLVIGVSRQLHYPRHVFWAALSFCNLLQISQSLMEIVALVGQSYVACQIYVLNAGSVYTVILLFLVLGALDRYLAIARYESYKRKVTNRAVIYLLLFASLFTYIIVTSPFWTGYLTFKTCTVNLTHMHCVLVYDLLLGVVCVMLHIMIFIRSRSTIIKHSTKFHQTPISLRFQHHTSIMVNPAGQDIEGPGSHNNGQEATQPQKTATTKIGQIFIQQLTVQNPKSEIGEDIVCFPWLRGRSRLSRLEFRAAFNMSVSVLPVSLITFPVTLNAIALYWCIFLKLNCSTIILINPYIKDLFLFQSIYNPMMYMFYSTEFRCALFRFLQKCVCIFDN